MTKLIKINATPSSGQLRLFGLLLTAALAVIGFMLFKKTGSFTWPAVLWCAAGLAVLLTAVLPAGLRYAYLGLSYAALPIGLVVSTAVLLVIFYLLLTPLALVFKILGRDPLDRRLAPDLEGYWKVRRSTDDRRRYLRQY